MTRLRRGLVLPVVAILAACGSAPGSNAPTAPTATPRGFDLSAWDVSTIGSGPTASEANGGVDLFIPATTHGDPLQQNLFALRLTARCHLGGDFDLQVDYTLTTWPARNGVRFGLIAGADSVERTSDPVGPDNTYATNFSGSIVQTATPDKSGRMRLTRVGTTITGYYLNSGSWVTIGTATAAAGSPAYVIQAWTDDYTFHQQAVRVNLKNLTATGCS
jgi:hypothetical protein